MKTKLKKRNKPKLNNYNEVVENVLNSISRHSGFSQERIKSEGDHHTVQWRRLAMYILSTHYDWPLRSIGEAFNQSSQTCYNGTRQFEELLNGEETSHYYRPVVNKVIEDLEL